MERSGAAKRLRSGPWKGSGHHEGCKGNSHERIRGFVTRVAITVRDTVWGCNED